MGKWLDRLSEIQNPTPKALTKLTKPTSVSFVSESTQESPEIKRRPEEAELRDLARLSDAEPAAALHQAIQQAQDWQDLSAILEQVQAALKAGHIEQQQAEELAVQVAELSRQFPERGPAAGEPEPMIWAVDLLAKKPAAETCYCCGQTAWWTKASGQKVCGVCHPDPRKDRHAA